jgi:hypothetical protein
LVPRKLVEIAFRRLWILAIPVALVPIAVMALNHNPVQYRASALVWIANPPGGAPALGHYNPYLSPSQNQANAFNDLLATESFRDAIAAQADLPPLPGGDIPKLAPGRVHAYSTGVNLLVIVGNADTAEQAKAAVAGAVAQFNQRAATQSERQSGLSEQYYEQQLTVAERELDARKAAVDDYVRSHHRQRIRAQLPAEPRLPGASTREEQQDVVSSLQQSLQDVQLKRVAAPQNQEASFAVLDEPKLPEAPVPTSMTRRFGYPLAGLLFGLFISSSYLYAVYRTDHTVLSSEDLAGLNVSLLGRVPDLNRSRLRWLPNLPLVPWGRHRDFARHTASAISSDAGQQA